MKHLQRMIAAIVAVLMVVLTVPMSYAEGTANAVFCYKLNKTTGTLNFQKNGGTKTESIYAGIPLYFFRSDYRNFDEDRYTIQQKHQFYDDFYSKVKTIRIDQSMDDFELKNQGLSDEDFKLAKQEFFLELEGVVATGVPFVKKIYYPNAIYNYSKSTYVIPFTFLGRLNGKYLPRDGGSRPSLDELKDGQKSVSDVNHYYGTNFRSIEECKAYLASITYELIVPKTIVFCKKGSLQQKVIDNYHSLAYMYMLDSEGIEYNYLKLKNFYYILLDDSTAARDTKTKVGVTYNNTAFASPVTMNTSVVSTGRANAVAYDITPKDAQGDILQPSEPVLLSIPIPDGWNEKDLSVVHNKDDGTTETMGFVVSESNIEFFTDSFSVFEIVNSAINSETESTSEEGTEQTTASTAENVSGEGKTQHLTLFQRIIQWFRNLFASLFGR